MMMMLMVVVMMLTIMTTATTSSRARSTQFDCCSFRVYGPTIWNKLPQDLRGTDTREQFKRRL